ncbi:hypothetical protein TNCV_2075101 [Trichonephila clavipes]|nr:hypothetical protein TNCV_2075101 [Trichonephila clavipes]
MTNVLDGQEVNAEWENGDTGTKSEGSCDNGNDKSFSKDDTDGTQSFTRVSREPVTNPPSGKRAAFTTRTSDV